MLSVTALGADIAAAARAAYAAADMIEFDGRQLRRDIALRAVAMSERVRRRRDASPRRRPRWRRELDVDAPLVGIVMGSKSDLPAMERAEQELTERGIRSEVRVMSAHREPDVVADYARNASCAGCG